MRCDQCSHWDKQSEYIRVNVDNKLVSHGMCRRTNGFSFEPEDKKSLAYCSGDAESGGILCCDEDFGCVQFEAVTNADDFESFFGVLNG